MGGFGRDPIPGFGAPPKPAPAPLPPTEPETPRLRVMNGPCAGRDFSLVSLRMRVGRNDPPAATVDIDLGDCELGSPAMVSRLHAELFWAGGQLYLVDLGSRNGTWVDGQPVKAGEEGPASAPVLLKPGARIRFANLESEIVALDSEPRRTPDTG